MSGSAPDTQGGQRTASAGLVCGVDQQPRLWKHVLQVHCTSRKQMSEVVHCSTVFTAFLRYNRCAVSCTDVKCSGVNLHVHTHTQSRGAVTTFTFKTPRHVLLFDRNPSLLPASSPHPTPASVPSVTVDWREAVESSGNGVGPGACGLCLFASSMQHGWFGERSLCTQLRRLHC